MTMRYIQRQNKDVKKDNEIYTKAKQRCITKTMRYIQRQNKDVNKDNEIYTKAKQRCKQRQ